VLESPSQDSSYLQARAYDIPVPHDLGPGQRGRPHLQGVQQPICIAMDAVGTELVYPEDLHALPADLSLASARDVVADADKDSSTNFEEYQNNTARTRALIGFSIWGRKILGVILGCFIYWMTTGFNIIMRRVKLFVGRILIQILEAK
jgi:hypothetical protein